MILEKSYSNQVTLAHRKKFAQFFTPEKVAQFMANWLLENPNLEKVLEPAFGLGVFSRQLFKKKPNLRVKGFDVDEIIFDLASENFKSNSNIELILEDYLYNDWANKYDGIICNPPYFKFHDYENKKALTEIKSKLGIKLNGFTNIYTLFLLKSTFQLNKNGRIAYLIPSEFLNSDYGTFVKDYLLKTKMLRHIIIFDFKDKMFDDALTTSAILLLSNDDQNQTVNFSVVENEQQFNELSKKINNYKNNKSRQNIDLKNINPNIKWRNYYQIQASLKYKHLIPFNKVAKVVRGIATGANEYFTFNIEKAENQQITKKYLLPCITKSKDITSPFFTDKDFEKLKKQNKNVFLFDGGKKPEDINALKYIELGEKQEIHLKYLTSKRNPWFLLENRLPSPIWVSVFNRNKIKFIRNEANVSNLTTFHCIYLNNSLFDKVDVDLLFAYLQTNIAQEIFNDNRREYGNGLKKFEPNDLNNGLILDLSKLPVCSKNEIKEVFQNYRKNIDNQDYSKENIAKIERILNDFFKIKKSI